MRFRQMVYYFHESNSLRMDRKGLSVHPTALKQFMEGLRMYKLMIVDDEMLMRLGVRSMVDWEEYGFRVVGEAGNGREAFDLALELRPDVIITDIKMPIMDGLQLIREASKALTGCKFIVLSNFDEFRYVKEAFQLGAADYLIKSEITPQSITELLEGIRNKLKHDLSRTGMVELPPDYSQSLRHLKENLFKDLISGLLDEREAALKAQQLQARVRSTDLSVLKLRIDGFENVRKKYVEKDEKLLRFSVVNILEEIIPAKWNREIVIGSSSEYLLIVNTRSGMMPDERPEIDKLYGVIQQTMRDFMNLTLSAGVSSVVPSFRYLKVAYQEADRALRRTFFDGIGRILYFEDIVEQPPGNEEVDQAAAQARELAFVNLLESGNEAKLTAFFESFRSDLASARADERTIREAYIRLTEIIGTRIPYAHRPRLHKEDRSPYEAVLSADTWEDMHRIVFAYASQCCRNDHRSPDQRSYADMAVEMIQRYYAEDISLQSVACQINVNPSYLSRIFKQEKGENFVAYLTRIRLERAKSLLESGRYKVYEVADKVGYHNYTYFSKIFKKVVGVSPEEYRG